MPFCAKMREEVFNMWDRSQNPRPNPKSHKLMNDKCLSPHIQQLKHLKNVDHSRLLGMDVRWCYSPCYSFSRVIPRVIPRVITMGRICSLLHCVLYRNNCFIVRGLNQIIVQIVPQAPFLHQGEI